MRRFDATYDARETSGKSASGFRLRTRPNPHYPRIGPRPLHLLELFRLLLLFLLEGLLLLLPPLGRPHAVSVGVDCLESLDDVRLAQPYPVHLIAQRRPVGLGIVRPAEQLELALPRRQPLDQTVNLVRLVRSGADLEAEEGGGGREGRRKRLDYSEKKMQIAQGRICNWKLYLGDNDITVKAPVALRISLNTNDAVFFSMVNPVT